jgi:hypothetical protein
LTANFVSLFGNKLSKGWLANLSPMNDGRMNLGT